MRTKLHYAERLEDFRASLQKFVASLNRPSEAERRCLIVSQVRDWKGYLAHMGKVITGIAGPSAPRVFSFVQRGSYHGDHPLRARGLGRLDDCVLRFLGFIP